MQPAKIDKESQALLKRLDLLKRDVEDLDLQIQKIVEEASA
jgi:hypothetical protein